MPDPRVLRVRRARSFDLNEVADLWTDCGLVPSPRGFRNEMERMLLRAPELFLVAMGTDNRGKIVGALLGSFDGRVATVSRLATHPDHRRQGVASALVADFTRALTDMGAEDALLLVLDGSPEADRFWAAIDYATPVTYRPTSDSRRSDDPVLRRHGREPGKSGDDDRKAARAQRG